MGYRTSDGKPQWEIHVDGCVKSFTHDNLALYVVAVAADDSVHRALRVSGSGVSGSKEIKKQGSNEVKKFKNLRGEEMVPKRGLEPPRP